MALVPFLQIVHISDIHIVAPGFRPVPGMDWVRTWLRRIGLGALDELVRDGTAASLPQARSAFVRFLPKITRRDAVFSKLPAWLVQTGDLTTFGDPASLQRGVAFIASLDGGPRLDRSVSVHGNHDAWPETLPILARERIEGHETALRVLFPNHWPRPPITASLPNNLGEVALWAVDTVDPRAWANTWARGEFRAEHRTALAAQVSGRSRERQLRILACHHPIRYPDPAPHYQMRLADQDGACAFLAAGAGNALPLAHLILGGHTHDVSPAIGSLPQSVVAANQFPLGAHQCQLIVGSLAQLDASGRSGPFAQQCQILRFFHDAADPDLVWMQRLLAARAAGQRAGAGASVGEFAILPSSIQSMSFEL